MKLYRYDIGTSRPITVYDSQQALITRLLQVKADTSVVCIYLGAGGVVGGHEAVSNQLFIITAGRGWVRTQDAEPIAIQVGQAAFWKAGEWHESGTHHGMVALVIEGLDVDPSQFMQELPDVDERRLI